MLQTKSVFAALVATCVVFQVIGCTVIGLTAGRITDASKHDEDTLHVMQVMNLKWGDEITIGCGSDSILRGVYLGMDEARTEQYIEKYSAGKLNNSNEFPLPSLDDSVVITRLSPLQRNVEGRLLGFDPGIIHVRAGEDVERISIQSVRTVAGCDGKVVEAKTLENWFQSGRVPFMSAILIKTGADTQRIPLHEVREVRIPNHKNSMLVGLVCGAALDLLILTTFRINDHGMK